MDAKTADKDIKYDSSRVLFAEPCKNGHANAAGVGVYYIKPSGLRGACIYCRKMWFQEQYQKNKEKLAAVSSVNDYGVPIYQGELLPEPNASHEETKCFKYQRRKQVIRAVEKRAAEEAKKEHMDSMNRIGLRGQQAKNDDTLYGYEDMLAEKRQGMVDMLYRSYIAAYVTETGELTLKAQQEGIKDVEHAERLCKETALQAIMNPKIRKLKTFDYRFFGEPEDADNEQEGGEQ